MPQFRRGRQQHASGRVCFNPCPSTVQFTFVPCDCVVNFHCFNYVGLFFMLLFLPAADATGVNAGALVRFLHFWGDECNCQAYGNDAFQTQTITCRWFRMTRMYIRTSFQIGSSGKCTNTHIQWSYVGCELLGQRLATTNCASLLISPSH